MGHRAAADQRGEAPSNLVGKRLWRPAVDLDREARVASEDEA
jgi:hypothetical protein